MPMVGRVEIAFVVPGPGERFHTLYLADGRVIVFEPSSGEVKSSQQFPNALFSGR